MLLNERKRKGEKAERTDYPLSTQTLSKRPPFFPVVFVLVIVVVVVVVFRRFR